MLVVLLLQLARADGWSPSISGADCQIFLGDASTDPVPPVRAECDWPVPPERLQHLLAQFDQHHRYFSNLEVSNRVDVAPEGGELIYQIHRLAGVPDRDVVLRFWAEPITGGMRYTWAKATDQSAGGAGVEIEKDSGYWEVTGGEAGLHLDAEIHYAPGGYVPPFVIRWFLARGILNTLGELRTYAETYRSGSGLQR